MLSLISVRTPAQNAVPKNDAKATAGSTFEGEIMDDHCAQMGSHDTTMKASALATPDLCTLYCIHFQKTPGKYVLFNTASKMIYQLDDQNQAQFFSDGRKVKVIGTYDQTTKTIHVRDIKSASES
jgi:hypothetical protein